MTHEERTNALVAHGFTPRQASFLTLVMLHSGVCVQRQYATFAGLANGQKVRDFFDALTERGFATVHECRRNGGHIYHVHHKALYRAIAEPDNRHRRAATLSAAVQRLMVLDVVLSHLHLSWLATESEKVSYFVGERGLTHDELPQLIFESRGLRTVRFFVDKLPIARRGHHDELLFLYVATDPEGQGLRLFLEAHRRLFERTQRWTLLIALPRFLCGARELYQAIVKSFAAPPIRLSLLEEFRWYCTARKAADDGEPPASIADRHRYTTARRAFGAPRFFAAYNRWLKSGDLVLNDLASPLLFDAFQRGDCKVEFDVLPHTYNRLAPAISLG